MVADLTLWPSLTSPAVGLLATDQGLDQRGLARSVGPDHADALAALDCQVQVAKQRDVERLGQLVGFDDDIAGPLDFVEPHDRTDDVAHGLDPVALEPLELALAVVGLLGALAGSVLADVGFELGGLLVLALGLALEHLGLLGRAAASTGCNCRGRA